MRVASVWLFLAALAGIILIVLAVPVYVLIQNINTTLAGQFDQMKEQQATFASAEGEIKDANAIIDAAQNMDATAEFTTILDVLDAVADGSITLNQVTFKESKDDQPDISLIGVSTTRSALSNFAQSVNDHPLFKNAELPISNLAKDRDIPFSMSISLQTAKP